MYHRMSPGERGDYDGFDSEDEDEMDDDGEDFDPYEAVFGTPAQQEELRLSLRRPEPGSFEAFEQQDGNSVEVDIFLEKWDELMEPGLDCGLTREDLRDALKLLAPKMRGTCLGKDRAAIQAQKKQRSDDYFNGLRAIGEAERARLARLAQWGAGVQ